jgi:hypothetical protein
LPCSNIKLYVLDSVNSLLLFVEFISNQLPNIISFFEVLVEVSEIYIYMILPLGETSKQRSLKSTILMRSVTTTKSDLSVANLYITSTITRYIQSKKSDVLV